MMLFLFQSFEVFRRLYRDPQQIHRIDPRLVRPALVGYHKNLYTVSTTPTNQNKLT